MNRIRQKRRENVNDLFKPRKETWLHRVNPAFKLALLIVLFGIVLFNHHFSFAVYQALAYYILWLTLSGQRWKAMLLLTVPLIFTFISSTISMTLFGKGENIWWTWGLIKISEESFQHGLLLGFKTLSIGALSLLFALTTKPIQLVYALMQQFRLSAKYAYSLIAAIRMLPVIWEEVGTRTNALEIRGMRFARSVRGWYERLSAYVIPLLAQSIRRAGRIAIAMESKRFHIKAQRTYFYPTAYSALDLWFAALMLCTVLTAFLCSRWLALI